MNLQIHDLAEALARVRTGEGEVRLPTKVEKRFFSLTPSALLSRRALHTRPLLVHLHIDAENMGKGLSREVAFRIHRICVPIPDLSPTGWVTLGQELHVSVSHFFNCQISYSR